YFDATASRMSVYCATWACALDAAPRTASAMPATCAARANLRIICPSLCVSPADVKHAQASCARYSGKAMALWWEEPRRCAETNDTVELWPHTSSAVRALSSRLDTS